MKHGGFVLLEVMLGVAVFAVGVLALGRCVENCVTAESLRQETDRARLALENRMAQIEGGETATDANRSDDLKGAFAGMTMKQTRKAVTEKNEKGQLLNGLYEVNLEVDWTNENQPQSRSLSFYVLRSR